MKKTEFTEDCKAFASGLYDSFMAAPCQSLDVLESKNTCLIIIDMVNGFAKHGNMYSKNIENINNDIAALAKKAASKGIPTAALCDCHTIESLELQSYPEHCMIGTNEPELTDEIKEAENIEVIYKNSTNGFLEPDFQQWLFEKHSEVTTFIVAGCCTDICIQQFTLSLKAYYNKGNLPCRIIVPLDMVDTFDSTVHNRNFAQISSLYNMNINGIEIVKTIK